MPNAVINRAPTDADIVDSTCNHQCSKCGSCCTAFLPLTTKEVQRIKDYIRTHHIVPDNLSDKDEHNLYIFCPFKDKDTNLCQIYPVRPWICRVFKCDQSMETIHKNKLLAHKRADYNACGLSPFDKGQISSQALFFDDFAYDIKYRSLIASKTGHEFSFEQLQKLCPLIADKYVEVKDGKLIIHKGGK